VQILTKFKGQASVVRERETIDSELRLLAAVRRSIREHGGQPSSRQVDELLGERLAHRGRAAGSAQKLLQVLATCRTTPTYC
jgi:hypothetical protein